jgi:feruloyl-CoA synthase
MGFISDPGLLFAPPDVRIEHRSDGTIVLRSGCPLARYSRAVGEWLTLWAAEAPHRSFLAERADNGGWRELSYRDALDAVRRIAQFLLDHDLDASRPVAILSQNSIHHALLSLSSMHVGIPVVPISVPYSLMTKDYRKLAHIINVTRPGLVFAEDGSRFAAAIRAVGLRDAQLVFARRLGVARVLSTSGDGTPLGRR